MNSTALKAELTADPNALGYAALLPAAPGAVCDLLNAPRYSSPGFIPRSDFAVWAGMTGFRSKIEDRSTNATDLLRSQSLLLLDFLKGGVDTQFDLNNSSVQALIAGYVSAGDVNETAWTEFSAGYTVQISRAQQLGLGPIAISDIIAALGA